MVFNNNLIDKAELSVSGLHILYEQFTFLNFRKYTRCIPLIGAEMKKFTIYKISTLILFIACIYSTSSYAGFLEMPDIEQSKDAKEKTLLRDMDVPPVRDRSPDPTAGPRLAVSEFRIQGLVEYPELGITRKALSELVESLRFDIMGEGKLLESGYTIEELSDLSDLLVDIEDETLDRHVTPPDVQKLVWLIREQRGKRGVTLGQIETVANKITSFYRKRGFILAKAYIPKQRVRDGIVNLTLLLGMLGEVKVNGNQQYKDDLLISVFDDLISKPVTNKRVEENLLLINDFPGISVDGYFEPGHQVGDTRLNINVKEEKRQDVNIRIDNHGTKESGLYRLYGDYQINNLIGIADYFKASVLQAVVPRNTTYWQLAFESNFFSPRMRLGITASKNQFVVDQSKVAANIDLNGKVNVVSISGRYVRERGRTKNSNYELRFENIKSDLQIGNLPDINNALDEELNHISLQYNYDFLDDANKRLHQGNIKYTNGTFVFGADVGQKEKYNILNADYTLLTFVKVPFTDSDSRFIFRTSAQYSGTNLSSIARFSLAGPTRNRGFSPSLFTADDAISLGADWVFNSPDLFDIEIASVNVKNLVKPFVFIDYGYGIQYSLIDTEKNGKGQLADVGLGLQFSHGSSFSGNLLFGFPVFEKLTNTDQVPKSDSMRIVFDFQYSY